MEKESKDLDALKMLFGETDKKEETQLRKKEIKGERSENLFLENNASYEKRILQKIEAALFLSANYLSVDEIVRVTGINPIIVKELVDKLIEKYNNTESAIVIHKREVEQKPVFKMDVKQEFHNLINKIVTGQTEFSKSEQETLAIIAYKQPIKQSSIVRIRSNKAYDHIKHFIAMGLVKSKRLGRTYELTLSEDFYQYFNLDKEKK